jgi:3-oxoadipate enol-lactonase
MAPIDLWLRENGMDRDSLRLLTMPWGMSAAFMSDEHKVLQALEMARQDPYPITQHGYVRQHAAVMAHDTTDRLGQIKAPTLVLVGAEDIMTPVSESRALAEAIPGSTLRILPRGGHGFTAEYPEEFNAAALEFLLS